MRPWYTAHRRCNCIRLGRLDEGRGVIEKRLRELPGPGEDIGPAMAQRALGSTDLLHRTGASVRYKAISAAVYGP